MHPLLRVTVPWFTPWAILTAALAAQGTVVDLGTLGGPIGAANDVSADGAVVVDSTTRADESTAAFYWTAAGGFVDILPPVGVTPRPSEATLVSADGSVAVGTWSFGSSRYAFRWSTSTGLVELGTLGGAKTPSAISFTGDILVGRSTTPTATRAFRYE